MQDNTEFYHKQLNLVKSKLEIPVRFKFLSKTIKDETLDEIQEGRTFYLSAEGLLLPVNIKKVSKWLEALLTHQIYVGLNILLPGNDDVIKALGAIMWIEAAIDASTKRIALGLHYKQIASMDKDKIFRFCVQSQLKR